MTPFRCFSLLKTGLLVAGLAFAGTTPQAVRAQSAPAPTLTAPLAPAPLVAPVVPERLTIADLTVNFSTGGRGAVQKLVDALYRHPAYLQQKVDRTDTYFPIVDRIFREEGIPADFRYLALQESGLVSDAVSSSNAVGFWQFKKESITDFGARVDESVDERRHIVESTRAAAKYFKRSNAQLHNWLNALLSYYTGLGGAKKLVRPEDANAREMTVTEATHPYIITFLAHKVAFEGPCGKNPVPSIILQEVKAQPGLTLAELALSLNANPEEVAKYNKWLLAAAIPPDKEYTVLVPVASGLTLATTQLTPAAQVAFPEPEAALPAPEITQVNGLRAVMARIGDTPDILALVAGVDVKRFRSFNDLHETEGVVPGRAYYLQKKRNRAAAEYHVAQPGETVAQISQQYGVKAKSLWKLNRMQKTDKLAPGRLVWLQHTRPSDVPVEYITIRPSTPDAAPAVASVSPVATTAVTAQLPAVEEALALPESAPSAAPTPDLASTSPAAPVAASEPAPVATAPTPVPVVSSPPAAQPEAPAKPVETPQPTVAQVSAPALAPTAVAVVTPVVAPAVVAPAVVTPVVTLPAVAAPTVHTVEKGESLSAISRQHGISLKNLLDWNALPSPALRPGQTLRLTAPDQPAVTTGIATPAAPVQPLPIVPDTDSAGVAFHTVQAGESLYRISREYSTTVQHLMELNSLADFNVKLGQRLVVRKL